VLSGLRGSLGLGLGKAYLGGSGGTGGARKVKPSSKMEALVSGAVDATGVAKERVRIVNGRDNRPPAESRYVLYWMTSSFRSKQNEPLEVAKALANQLDLPLVVLVTVDLERYRAGSIRHVVFLLEGLAELDKALKVKRVHLVVRIEPPVAMVNGQEAINVLGSEEFDVQGFTDLASIIVLDRQYLRHARRANDAVIESAPCLTVEVESRLSIPLEIATPKGRPVDPDAFFQTYFETARKFCQEIVNQRVSRKIVLCDLSKLGYHWHLDQVEWTAEDWLANESALKEILNEAGVDTNVVVSDGGLYQGGEASARKLLTIFLTSKLRNYRVMHMKLDEDLRPEYGSMLAPYITFGFITTSDVLMKLYEQPYKQADVDALTRNLAKRELAYHTCYYVPTYDSYDELLPKSVRQSLAVFANYRGPQHRYSTLQWERAEIEDENWNAAQSELLNNGRGMRSNRMRWCQKIVETERNPAAAFTLALFLNDKYMLDALDPCSITGVADCFYTIRAPDAPLDRSFVFGFGDRHKALMYDEELDVRDRRKSISPITPEGGSNLRIAEF